ncbi:MAG TPA: hypothetical protein VFP44_18295 [Usitatibacter sp.]|nr:hypothetical protein [Usitatibacter sp.]
MTNREEYIAELKVRLDRFNAAIARSAALAGKPLTELRQQRERVLAKLRTLRPGPRA